MTVHTLDLQFTGVNDAIAAFAIEGTDGVILIESGPYSTYPQLASALHAKGLDIAQVSHVLVSHIHFDHAGAAWALANQGATIYVHPKGLPHLQNPQRLYDSARQIYGDQMDTLWGRMESIAPERLVAVEHGETLHLMGFDCAAWYTPGHAVHHVVWTVAPSQAVDNSQSVSYDTPRQTADIGQSQETVCFTGDVAGVRIGPAAPVMPPCPPPDIHIEDWLASIQLLRDLPVERLFLTHFGEISDKSAHLDALERHLTDWAAWIKPYAIAQTPIAEIVHLFQEYVRQQLLAAGVNKAGMARYDTANPAFMSVAGLVRYWKKYGLVDH